MNKLKSTVFALVAITSLTVFLTSCEKDLVQISESNGEVFNETLESIQNLDEQNLSAFKSSFPSLIEKAEFNYTQNVSVPNKMNKKEEIEGTTFPVMNEQEVIGRYLGLNDESAAIYIDFSDYQNQITIYDVNNPTKFEVVETVFDSKTNSYLPVQKYSKNTWCKASCYIGSMAIAASDGPAPFMDVLAVSYGITCIAACVYQ